MRCGTPRRSEQNQSLDEEIGKIPEQLQKKGKTAQSHLSLFLLSITAE
jgi:hypothetical protein